MKIILAALTALLITGCSSADNVYTLYRTSPRQPDTRIHVATFDAKESADYYRGNCETARGLFARQTGVTSEYWCESGRFHE